MQTPEGTIVKTRVTFRVSDPLAGKPGIVEVLDFLGGEADGVGLKIAGMPAFAAGDRRVVFARRDRSINPIVGFTQGLMRVTRDGNGIDRVLTLEGMPLARPESIGTATPAPSGAPGIAMRLTDLRARIAEAVAAKAGNR